LVLNLVASGDVEHHIADVPGSLDHLVCRHNLMQWKARR
jgi:hypothetical protein